MPGRRPRPLPAPPHATAPVSAWRPVQLQSARAAAAAGSGPRFAAPGALAGSNRALRCPCFRPRRPVPRRWPDLADQLALRSDLRVPGRRRDPPTRPRWSPLCLVAVPRLMTSGGGLQWRGMPQTLRCAAAMRGSRFFFAVSPGRSHRPAPLSVLERVGLGVPWAGEKHGSGYGAPGHSVDSLRRALPWGSVCRSSRFEAPCALERRARAPSVPPFVWSPEGRSSSSWTPAVPAAGWERSLLLAGRGRGPCGCAVQAFSLPRSGRLDS